MNKALAVFAGTMQRLKADKYMAKMKQEWSRKLMEVLSELSSACAASNPSEKEEIGHSVSRFKTPDAQCSLQMLPAGPATTRASSR